MQNIKNSKKKKKWNQIGYYQTYWYLNRMPMFKLQSHYYIHFQTNTHVLYFDLQPSPKILFQGNTPEGSDTFQRPAPSQTQTLQIKWEVNIIVKKSSCVLCSCVFLPASFILASVIIASVCIQYIYVCNTWKTCERPNPHDYGLNSDTTVLL